MPGLEDLFVRLRSIEAAPGRGWNEKQQERREGEGNDRERPREKKAMIGS